MTVTSNTDAVFARLAGQARRLADVFVQSRRLARSDPARRWRSAALLWPLFTKG